MLRTREVVLRLRRGTIGRIAVKKCGETLSEVRLTLLLLLEAPKS